MKEVKTLKLNIKRNEVPVEIEGTGTFKLLEMDGTLRDSYLNSVAARMKYSPDGRAIGIKDYSQLYTDLIHATLVDENGKPVKKEIIQSWSASSLKQLFTASQELNALQEDQEEIEKAAKNA